MKRREDSGTRSAQLRELSARRDRLRATMDAAWAEAIEGHNAAVKRGHGPSELDGDAMLRYENAKALLATVEAMIAQESKP
jgi:hypothetical protein